MSPSFELTYRAQSFDALNQPTDGNGVFLQLGYLSANGAASPLQVASWEIYSKVETKRPHKIVGFRLRFAEWSIIEPESPYGERVPGEFFIDIFNIKFTGKNSAADAQLYNVQFPYQTAGDLAFVANYRASIQADVTVPTADLDNPYAMQLHRLGAKYQTDSIYPIDAVVNFYRPDGWTDQTYLNRTGGDQANQWYRYNIAQVVGVYLVEFKA